MLEKTAATSEPWNCHGHMDMAEPWAMASVKKQWQTIKDLIKIIKVVVSSIFYFHPYLGKWSNRGWIHQPEKIWQKLATFKTQSPHVPRAMAKGIESVFLFVAWRRKEIIMKLILVFIYIYHIHAFNLFQPTVIPLPRGSMFGIYLPYDLQ